MALFLILNALVFNGALWFFSPEGYKDGVLPHSVAVLRGDGLDDSWGIMPEALDYAQSPHATPLDSEIFFNRHVKFQYPPTALLAISGMRLVDRGAFEGFEAGAGVEALAEVAGEGADAGAGGGEGAEFEVGPFVA